MTEKLGRYEILEEIGQGGFAVVYRAHDRQLDRLVALKELKAMLLNDADLVKDFRQEARNIARLDHPHVVTIYDVYEAQQRQFIVMQLVDGSSLEELIATQGHLSWSEAVEIITALAAGLDYAFTRNILHRDLKPANILLDSNHGPMLSDFGLAKLIGQADTSVTASGGVVGTPHYIAPEVWAGRGTTRQSDLYALGCILYEMLIAEKLFPGETSPAVMLAHFKAPTLPETWPKDVPPGVAKVFKIALAKKPGDRYITAGEMVQALVALTADKPSEPDRPLEKMEPDTAPKLGRGDVETPSTAQPASLPAPQQTQVVHNLPPQPTPFIGREKELTVLDELMAKPEVRLVTIVGPGGMGKTRLALKAAEAQLPNFKRGVYFVPLAPLSSEQNIVPAVAEAVGFQFHEGSEPKGQLLGYFRQKHILLLIDNFEHVLDGAGLVSEILQTAPGLKVLATSREKLNLQEEIRFRLEGMAFPASMPAATETPENAAPVDADSLGGAEYSAVKLFMQSAQRARPGFELETDDLRHVARICQLVGGMPLGILLAAAWVEMFSLPEIAAEISQSLDFLETELRDVPDRHRSIHAIFDSSWNQLSATEREIFMKLSVFRGGFKQPAAQAVAGASLRALVALVNKSLLRRDPTSGRYETHELLRQYAGEQLEAAGQADQTRNAHCTYYAKFMHQRQTEIRAHPQIAVLDEIEADFENVRQMWQRAVKQKDYTVIDRSLESLYVFCDIRSRYYEGEELFRQTREEWAPQPNQEPHPAWGRVLLPWYDLQGYISGLEDYDEIIDQAKSSLAVAQKRGDQSGIAHGLVLLGAVAGRRGNFTEAITFYNQSLTHYRDLDDAFWITMRIGLSYKAAGQPDQALKSFQQALDRGREVGDRVKIAWALTNMGETVVLAGNDTQAENYWREAHSLFRQIGTPVGVVWMNANLSLLTFLRGDFKKAKTLAEEALEIARDINYIDSGYRRALIALGWRAVVVEEYAKGKRHFEEVLATIPSSLEANLGLSLVAHSLEDHQAVKRYLQTALKSTSAYRIPAMVMLVLPVAAITLAAHKSKREQAVEWLALAFHHPSGPTGLLEKWPLLTRLRADLEAALGPKVYAVAWERGQSLDLAEALTTLAAHFQTEALATQPFDKLGTILSPPDSQPLLEPLSERELDVLRLLKTDLSGPEIARELMVSLNTIRFHTKNIYSKLQVNNRRTAVRQAEKLAL